MGEEPRPGALAALALLTVECGLDREGIEEISDAALLDGLWKMSVGDHMGSEGRGFHSCLVVAICSVPLLCFRPLIIEKLKLDPRIRPNRELEVGDDATENEELFGASSVLQEALHAHENAREKREGIVRGEGGEREESWSGPR